MSVKRIFVDETHCGGRHVTGLERITLELFSAEALAPLELTSIRAASKIDIVVKQNITLPLRMAAGSGAIALTPGFPPSYLLTLFGERVIPYIHDLFLITRWQDLNASARLYMSGPFRFALRRLPRFFVNSETTGRELQGYCRTDAEIMLYRPDVRNVFGLADTREEKASKLAPVSPKLIALGTVEPRKNLRAAARILNALRASSFPDARLDIVGRIGWGPDAEHLATVPGVTLHGYQSVETVRRMIEEADALISTSHDEGLGLPLLEAQYAGLAIIAPDKPVFREVLGDSAAFIDTDDASSAAARIAALFEQPDWRMAASASAAANLRRWSGAARADRAAVIARLTELTSGSLQR